MQSILVKNITVINTDGAAQGVDILLRGGKVEKIGAGLKERAERFIDGSGLYAFPGFIDLHCHLRDPGLTHKEDIASGTRSAAAGGFTTVCCMPNTKPPVDNVEQVRYILDKAENDGYARVLPVASVTKGMAGKELTDFAALYKAGAIALSDDGLPVQDDEVILAAMAKAKELGILLMLHEEDLANRGDGAAHEGKNAVKAGIPGIPRQIEDAMTARDIYYAQKTGARIHICHVSTMGGIELVRRAKQNGVNVTCETAPHYFSLTDEAILDGNPNTKVNPPLREESDRQAVVAGIMDGTVDAIATDHAPHSPEEKKAAFADAPFGLIGFETAFSLAVTILYREKKIGLQKFAALLSANPAKILGIEGGKIEVGARADIAICNLDKKYIYREANIVSKSKNSPFLGKELFGRMMYTIMGGNVTYER